MRPRSAPARSAVAARRLALTLIWLCLAPVGSAAPVTWDKGGASLLWGTAANWNPDGIPGVADDVTFAGNLATNDLINLGGVTRSIDSLLANATVDFSLVSGTLNLIGSNGSGYNLQKQQAQNLSISSSITLGNAAVSGGTTTLVWGNDDPAGLLNVNGTVAKANAGQTVNLVKADVGTINFNSNAAGSFGWNATTINAGVLAYRPTVAQTTSFGSGAITLGGGGAFAFNAGASGTYTVSNNVVVAASGGRIDFSRSVTLVNPAHVMTGNVQLGGTLDLSAGPGGAVPFQLDLTGTVTITGGNRMIHSANDSGSPARISGNIVEDGTPRVLTLANGGTRNLVIAGAANAWSGGTIVSGGGAGMIEVAQNSTLGTGGVTVGGGGRLRIQSLNNVAGTRNIQVNASGLVDTTNMTAADVLSEVNQSSIGIIGVNQNSASLDLNFAAAPYPTLFVGTNQNTSLTVGWTPHSNVYRVAGGVGGSTLTLNAANVLTGAARSVVYGGGGNNGQTTVGFSQDYAGGTAVNGGLVNATAPGSLGFGDVVINAGGIVNATAASVIEDPSTLTVNAGGTFSTSSLAPIEGAKTATLNGGLLTLNKQLNAGTSLFDLSATLTAPSAVRVNNNALTDGTAAMQNLTMGPHAATFTATGSAPTTGIAVTGTTSFTGSAGGFDVQVINPGPGNGNVGVALNGPVAAPGATLVKTGPGSLGLFNVANVVGGYDVREGRLAIGSEAAYGGAATPLLLNGGTFLTLGTGFSFTAPITLGPNGGTVDNSSGSATPMSFDTPAVGTTGVTPAVRTLTLTGVNGKINSFNSVIADPAAGGGATALVKSGTTSWRLNAVNTFTGGTTIEAGTLTLGVDGALGVDGGPLTMTGGTLNVGTFNLFVGDLNATGGTITRASGATQVTLSTRTDGNATFAGTLLPNGTLNFDKRGTGTLTITTSQPIDGNVSVRGTLALGGAAGRIAGPSTGLFVNSGGNLILGDVGNAANNTSSRVTAAVPLKLSGGMLTLALPGAAAQTQALGSLTIDEGANTITGAGAATAAHTITFTDLAPRFAGSTLNVTTAVNFGQITGTGGVRFLTAPALSNGILGGFAVVNNGDWATLDASGFVAPYGGYTSNLNPNDTTASGWVATNNMTLPTAASASLLADRTVHSLRITSNATSTILNLGTANLTINSGGILDTGAVGDRTITGGSIKTGPTGPDLVVHVNGSGGEVIVGSKIDIGIAGLTKGGLGTLTLTNPANTFNLLTVARGTLQSTAQGALGPGFAIHLHNATLRTSTVSQTIDAPVSVMSNLGATLSADNNLSLNFTYNGQLGITEGVGLNVTGSGTLNGAPAVITLAGPIKAAGPINVTANPAAGRSFRLELLAGSGNAFGGGVNLVSNNLGVTTAIGSNTALGTGPLTINGSSNIEAIGSSKTIPNRIVANADFAVTGTTHLLTTGELFLGGNRTITVADAFSVVGRVTDGGNARSLTKAGLGKLTLGLTPSEYTGATTVSAGTLSVLGSVFNSSGVTVNAGAVFEAGKPQDVKALVVNSGGLARLLPGVQVLRTNASTLGGGAAIDLVDGMYAVDYAGASPLGLLRNQIISGFNSGAWTGPGIRSSLAAGTNTIEVGYAEASQVLGSNGGTLLGKTFDATTVLVRTTLAGDATLDGIVDFNDLVKLAQNYNVIDGNRKWFDGDFTYDGNTDFNDLVKLAQNYNTTFTPPVPGAAIPGAPAGFGDDLAAAFAAAAQTPEPGAALLVACAVGTLARRRRMA